MSTVSSPSASRNATTAGAELSIGCSSVASLTPNPGSSSTRQRNDGENVARLPPKLRQPVTPGPEPCSISSGGPSPTS